MTKTVTVEGIGTADYTLPEYRNVRRLLLKAKTDWEREEARAVAELTHAIKVYFPGAALVTSPEDHYPLPDEGGTQLGLM